MVGLGRVLEDPRGRTDGTLGPVSTLVNEECYGPVSASNQQGQLLVSYIKYGANFRSRRVASRLIGAAIGGGGDAGSSGAAGSAGAAGSSMNNGGAASGSTNSGGAIGTAGSGTAGSVTAGTTGSGASGGGAPQPPVVITCSLHNVGDGRESSSAGVGFGLLFAAVAGVFARRRRRADASTRSTLSN